MSSPSLEEPWERLHRYWLSKHVDGRPPARADIDPIVDIPQLVANLMILEAGPMGYIYRLAGSEVVDNAGTELTGRQVGYSQRHAHVMPQWVEALDFVRLNQIPRLIVSHFAGDAVVKNIVLVLPLHAPDGTAAKLLVGSFYRGNFTLGMRIEGVSVREMSYPMD
jgi:hypothetical protein